MKNSLLLPFFFLFIFVSCHSNVEKSTVETAYSLMQENKAVIVDIRETYEVQSTGILKGAIHIPTSDISRNSPKWSSFIGNYDKRQPLYFYCEVGSRAGSVARWLSKNGFNATNLGGLRDLQQAGLPIVPLTP